MTPVEVLTVSFGDADVAAAFRVRGVTLPPHFLLPQKEDLLLVLFLDFPAVAVVDSFDDKGVTLVPNGPVMCQMRQVTIPLTV